MEEYEDERQFQSEVVAEKSKSRFSYAKSMFKKKKENVGEQVTPSHRESVVKITKAQSQANV
jgi:hypothetical protein